MKIFDNLYELFKRKTASTHFIPAIDGLRFLAIWMVVMDHLHGFIRTKIPYTYVQPSSDFLWFYNFFDSQGLKGVLLFFMISGFILGMPFAKHYWQNEKKPKLKSYFWRRLTRLEPPYFFNILVCYLVLILYTGHDFAASFERTWSSLLPNVLSSLAYLHYTIFPGTFSVNPVTWSLELEVQFYILVPLLVLIFKLPKLYRRILLVLTILVLPLLQRTYALPVNALTRPDTLIYNYLQYFLLGFLLLDVYLSGFKLQIKNWLAGGLGLLLFANFFYLQTYTTPYMDLLLPFIIFAIGVLVLMNDFWQNIFSIRFFTAVGGMCYSIYLWHNLIISAVANKTVHINISQHYIPTVLWQFALVVPFILGGSAFFYLLIEKPCMDRDWPQKLWRFIKVKIFRQPTIESN